MRQRLAANAGWLLGDKLLRLGVGVWINAWIARHLGPALFGEMNYAAAIVALFTAFATVGLPEVLVRDYVRLPERARAILASGFVLRLGGGVATILLALLFVRVAQPGNGELALLVLIFAIGPLAQAVDVIDLRYQANHNMRDIVLLRNAGFVAVSIARIIALLLGAGVVAFAVLTTAELLFTGFLIFRRSLRDGPMLRLGAAEPSESLRLLRESWPLMLRLFAIAIYMRLDQVLIGQILGDAQVGVYAAAARVSEVWYLALTAATQATAPRFAALRAQDPRLYEQRLVLVMRILFRGSVLVGAVISLAAPWIIRLLYGAPFAGATPVLVLHVWAGVFVAIGLVASTWLVNERLVHYGLMQAVAGAVVSVVINLVLIPRIGIIGAAWAALCSYAVSAFLFNAIAPRTRPIFRLQLRAMGFK